MNVGQELIIFLTFISTFSIVICFMKLSSEANIEYEESVNVRLNTGNRVRRSVEIIGFMGEYHLKFAIEGSEMHLHLEQNTNIHTSVPTLTLNGGSFSLYGKDKAEQNSAFYQDVNSGSPFMVQQNKTGGQSMIGVLRVKNRDFVIQSDEDISKGQLFAKFKIFKQKIKDVDFTDFSMAENDIQELKNVHLHERHKRATGEYQLELLIVVDFSIYSYWYEKSTASDTTQKAKEAIESTKQYYAFVINGIDSRFKNIQTTDYTITVLFAGIIIAQTADNAQWTETIKIVIPGLPMPIVDSKDALERFRAWVLINSQKLPGHDHAMLFTRYDLTVEDLSTIPGLAYAKQVCKLSSQSIVEDNFGFVVLTIAGHELGHSLGAVHDGDGNTCSSTDNYIMSPTSSSLTQPASVPNQWKFSSCSTEDFTSYINALDSISSNCLKNVHPEYNATALSEYQNDQPGQVYDADAQCKQIIGTSSYFCKGLYNGNFTSICTGLFCADPKDPGQCKKVLASDGTLCGDKKWCQSGECVFDTNAPEGNASCLYGDTEGQVFQSQTCSDIVSNAPSKCANVAIECCDSCAPYLISTATTEQITSSPTAKLPESSTSEATTTAEQTSVTTPLMTESSTSEAITTVEQTTITTPLMTESSASEATTTAEETSITTPLMTKSSTSEATNTEEQTSTTISQMMESSTFEVTTTAEQTSITSSLMTESSTFEVTTTSGETSITTPLITESLTSEAYTTAKQTSITTPQLTELLTSDATATEDQTSSTKSQLKSSSTLEPVSTSENSMMTNSTEVTEVTTKLNFDSGVDRIHGKDEVVFCVNLLTAISVFYNQHV